MELNNRLFAAREALRKARESGRTRTPTALPSLSAHEKILYQNGIPGAFKKVMSDVYENRPGLRRVIKAKCLECCGFEDAYDRIGNCSTKRCPLWRFRPFQKRSEQ